MRTGNMLKTYHVKDINMAAIKNLVISICELYEQGYTVERICNIYQLPMRLVSQVLCEYCEEYSEIA